ncbi:cytochrome c oxidase subunit 5B, mitochondrial-like [Leptidea sinapis]|uniref:cytochrome c oxidase subunit 5B, mitochondrial-like n=1 Tax=Leptidea sinapis TaxID=189913 RepID=UPI00212F2799|nr:cytochrome c oxidase subunit 5B, mitochondrial-like [Leptidea sinapis]
MWSIRPVLNTIRRSRVVGRRYCFHDTLDQLTGIEKRELLAHLAGDCDPFRMLAIKKGPGTWQCPNLIPSANDKRLVCCLCDPNDMHVKFMWLHKNQPKRCYCGFWFMLCPVAPL